MRRPPIEGLPELRPMCANCGRFKKPVVHAEWDHNKSGPSIVTRRQFVRWDGYEEFCTLWCARKFAHAAYVSGFRRSFREHGA